jgi:hypothetical protein
MLPESYKSQVQHIQPSPKFHYQASEGQYRAVPFPGYTVITPPWIEETENTELYERLQTLQQQLVDTLPADLLIPLPPESFHITLADLIWDGAYRHADANPEFQPQLREYIRQSFAQCQSVVQTGQPAFWQVMGLIVMNRAVGVFLAPKDEDSYNRILELRRSIYQNPSLMGLGIEQQYHLNAHITLGYFGDRQIAEIDREQLGDIFNDLNFQWLSMDCSKLFLIHQAELRKFDDMTRYYREPDWPQLVF